MKTKIKRILAVILTAAMSLTMISVTASAASAKTSTPSASISSKSSPKVWTGKTSTSWFTGKKKSYNIKNAEQLAGLAKIVNKGIDLSGITFNLTSDIVLNDTSGYENWEKKPPKNVWTPIGYSNKATYRPFNGIFNGNGHVIKGLYATGSKSTGYRSVGLFGYVYCGAVTSLSIQKSLVKVSGISDSVTSNVCTGAIAGIAEGSIINQCENWDCIVKAIVPNSIDYGLVNAYAGGIVGYIGVENVSGVLAVGIVEALLGAGGLIANPALFNDGSGGMFKSTGVVNCINGAYAYASAPGDSYAGGIVGYGADGVIQNCLGLYEPKAKGSKFSTGAGVLAGRLFQCPVNNCYYYEPDGKDIGVGDFQYTLDNKAKKSSKYWWVTDVKTIYSKDLADALGDAFIYRKNNTPQLAAFKKTSSSSSK